MTVWFDSGCDGVTIELTIPLVPQSRWKSAAFSIIRVRGIVLPVRYHHFNEGKHMKKFSLVVVVLAVCVGLLGVSGFAQDQKQKRTPEEQFARMDKDGNKKLSVEEFVGTRTAEKADKAKDQFKKLSSLESFREWYDPSTGKGYGAREQLWSAALYLRAAKALKKFQ